MNFLSDNLVYRRGQDYMRRRREKQQQQQQQASSSSTSKSRSRSAEREEGGLAEYDSQHAALSTPSEGTATANASRPARQRRWSTLPYTRTAVEGDSADDEGESSARDSEHLDFDAEEDAGGGDGWRHTDRVVNARLSRGEQLQREKGVVEEALRSSLSTLMLLKAGTSSSGIVSEQASVVESSSSTSTGSVRSPPLSLSTSPSSTLTVREPRHHHHHHHNHQVSSPPSSGRSPPKQRRLSGTGTSARMMGGNSSVSFSHTMERQHTFTRASPLASGSSAGEAALALHGAARPASSSLTQVGITRQLSRSAHARLSDTDWTDGSANVSSTSSFEDLGSRLAAASASERESREGSDLDMDFLESATGSPMRSSPMLHHSGHTRAQAQAQSRTTPRRQPRRPRRSRVNSLRRSTFASNASQDGSLSDPGTRRASDVTADDSFLELLEAAKTFMAMDPRYGPSASTSTTSTAVRQDKDVRTAGAGVSEADKSWAMDTILPEGTPRGRTTLLDEVMRIPSNASRDSSPRGSSPIPPASMSTSATFDLSSSDSPPSHGLTSSRGGDEDVSRTGEEYNAITPPQPTTFDPRLSADAKREMPVSQQDDHEKPNLPAKPESWREWISRQLRRFTVGISVIGVGLVIAVGVGLLKAPMIRKGTSRYSIPALRVTF